MKHILLLLFAIFLLQPMAFSQSKLDTSSVDGGKWEIGVDLYSAFFTGPKLRSLLSPELKDPVRVASDLPILQHSLLFKYSLSEQLKLRSRLGFTFEERRNRPNSLPETYLLSGGPLGGYISVGMERYVRKGRVSAFFGGDIFGYFFRHVERADHLGGPALGYEHRLIYDFYSDQQYGLNTLLGMNIRLLHHFYLSAEASLRLAYRRQYTDFNEHWDETLISYGGATLKRFAVTAEPISAIHLIYHF